MSTRLGGAPEEENAPVESDADLIAAIRAGRTEAWGQVYVRYLDRVYGVCFAVLRNRADAEDAAQETFLRAVERLEQLRDARSLKGWLSGIARHSAIDRIRRSRETPVDDWPAGEPADEPDSASGLSRRETIALVVEALDGLEARDRLALVLSDVDGYDGEALAEPLGVRRDHAYTLVGRARERFERSVAALVVGRTGRRDCHELAALIGPADGPPDPRLRKGVARHIDACERCRETRSESVSPAALLSVLPPIVTPAALRAGLANAHAPGATSPRSGSARRLRPRRGLSQRLLVGVSAVALAGAAITVSAIGREGSTSHGAVSATSATTVARQPPAARSAGFCAVAEDWWAGLTPVPVSTSPAAVEAWFTRNLGFVERLAAAAPSSTSARWEEYRAAYADLVETLELSHWDAGPPGADTTLSALRDELEADLAERCDIGGGSESTAGRADAAETVIATIRGAGARYSSHGEIPHQRRPMAGRP